MWAVRRFRTCTGLLLDRVRKERFPNPEHLDRIEASVRDRGQVREYLEILFEKVEGQRHPSSALLDRIERLAALQQQKSRRRA